MVKKHVRTMVSFLISPLFTQWSSLVLGPGLRYPRDLPCGELRTASGFSAAMAAFGARRNQDVWDVRTFFVVNPMDMKTYHFGMI